MTKYYEQLVIDRGVADVMSKRADEINYGSSNSLHGEGLVSRVGVRNCLVGAGLPCSGAALSAPKKEGWEE